MGQKLSYQDEMSWIYTNEFASGLVLGHHWSHNIPRLRAVDEKCLSPTAEPRTKH